MLNQKDLAMLQFPFKANEHAFLKENAYIREEAITDRIEMVDPSWSLEQISLYSRPSAAENGKPSTVCTMRLTIKGVSRDGVGMADVSVTKSGAAEANEAEKSAATDALKRAARLFGIGRYLLELPNNVVNVETLRNYLVATYANTPSPFDEPQTPPQPPPAAAAQAAKADPPRVAELRNEMLTITNIQPRSDSAGWYGIGYTDGLETRVNLFAPEDVDAIKAAGYEFKTGNVQIPVILRIQDNRLRIATVTPKQTENPPKTIVSSFQTNLTQGGKPYLIFTVGDSYAYSFTREPFRAAGYDVDGWDTVGYHEMPTPAELICEWDKQKKNLSVKSAVMVDVFEKAAS